MNTVIPIELWQLVASYLDMKQIITVLPQISKHFNKEVVWNNTSLLWKEMPFGAIDAPVFTVWWGKDPASRIPLMRACKNGAPVNHVSLLISGGSNVNADVNGWTALHWTCRKRYGYERYGYERLAKVLLEAKADPNIATTDGEWTPLMYASNYKCSGAMGEALIASGANVNQADNDGLTALMIAAHCANVDMTRFLLNARADVSMRNNHGWTALMKASDGYDNSDVIHLLLNAHADISTTNRIGRTALMMASNRLGTNVISVLLNARADVSTRDIYGRTALMIASDMGNVNAVRLLLNARADISTKDNDGKTALMLACSFPSGNVVRVLLSVGADVSMKDNKGRTALDIARERRYTDVIEMLKSN